jgi:hypothetical protein
MLLSAGIIAGKNTSQKFAFFIFCFAVWDIFYYVFLKLLLDWPVSLFTWDILFLIPIPWVGPVIAPCIISITMIMLTLIISWYQEKIPDTKLKAFEWCLLIFGSLIVIASFIWDYVKYVYKGNPAGNIWTLSSKEQLFSELINYVPTEYNWFMFSIGEFLLLLTIALFIKKQKKFTLKQTSL